MKRSQQSYRKSLKAHLAGWIAHYTCRPGAEAAVDPAVQRTSERTETDVVDTVNRALFALVTSTKVMKTTGDTLCNNTFDVLQGAAQSLAALDAGTTPVDESATDCALDAMEAVGRLRDEIHSMERRIAAHVARTSASIDRLTACMNQRRFEAFRATLMNAATRETPPPVVSECYLCTETAKEPAWIAAPGCAHPPHLCCLDCLTRASFSLFRDGRSDEAACPHCRAPFTLSALRVAQ